MHLLVSLPYIARADQQWNTIVEEIPLPNMRVISITKDTLGRIWLATSHGVMLFDGFEAIPLPVMPQKVFNYVQYFGTKNRILAANRQEIWSIDCNTLKVKNLMRLADRNSHITYVGSNNTQTGLIFSLSNGAIYRLTSDDKVKLEVRTGNPIQEMTEDEKGTIYFASKRSIYRYTRKKIEWLTTNKKKGHYSSLLYAKNKLMVGTWYSGFYTLALPGMQHEQSLALDTIKDVNIVATAITDSFFYIANDNYSFFRYDRNKKSLKDIAKDYKNIFYGILQTVYSLTEQSPGLARIKG